MWRSSRKKARKRIMAKRKVGGWRVTYDSDFSGGGPPRFRSRHMRTFKDKHNANKFWNQMFREGRYPAGPYWVEDSSKAQKPRKPRDIILYRGKR